MIDFILSLSILQQCILYSIAASLLVQFMYYLLVYLRPVFWKRKTSNPIQEPISVIICAKNERANLKEHLPLICNQNYSNFEVIVVNDCSEDDSDMLLAELEQEFKVLRHTSIEIDRKFRHGKKMAINIGIKSAQHELLVFTDADCMPTSKNWLNEISQSYTPNKEIILGYGGYKRRKGLLNRIVRFDTMFIAMQYFGIAMMRKPYMGIGRNLSYKKSFYNEGSGFRSHYHITSGDDDLFINEHGTKKNTTTLLAKDAFTRSNPPPKFSIWAKQKKRHLTTAKYYKKRDKLMLGIENATRFIFYTAIAAGFVFLPLYLIPAIALGFRLLFQLIIIKLNMNKMDEKGFLLLIPLLDIILPFIYFSFIFANKFNSKRNQWN